MGRPELTRLYAAAHRRGGPRARSSSTVNNASSPAFKRSRRGSDVSAEGTAAPLSRRMPAGRDHPRRHARRGGSDRRGDLRSRHPDHRSAAELARPAEEHRAACATVRRPRAGRRRDGARAEPGGARCSDAGGRHRSSRPTPTSTSSPRRSRPGLVSCPAISRRPKRSPRSAPARTRSSCSRPKARRPAVLKAQRAVLPQRRAGPRRSAGSSPTTCGRGSMPAPTGFGLGVGPLQARPVGRRNARQGARLCRRAAAR